MEIKSAILTNNPCYRANRTISPKGLMLHSVGCPQPNAEVFYRSWNKTSYDSACVHAFIDANTGIIWQTLPWNWRAWHCGGSGNNTHIGVEMCEPESIHYNSGSSFTCSNPAKAKEQVARTYEAAVELFAKLCTEFGLDPSSIVSHKEGYDRGIASNHGDPEHLWKGLGVPYTMNGFRADVRAKMNGETEKAISPNLSTLTNAQAVEELGKLAKKDPRILASLTTAQAILESGYGRSELAMNANNLFGMKANLSGNAWPGSVWDGRSVYMKLTTEVENGETIAVRADFRRYPSLEDSVKDHAAYLVGSGRYDGIQTASFDEACQILLKGGYATDPGYPAKLRSLYDAWNLGALDGGDVEEVGFVRETFTVRVIIDDLRIRTGPGTQHDFTQYIKPGVYTIVETSGNWGRLKSGAGWICLDYAKRI